MRNIENECGATDNTDDVIFEAILNGASQQAAAELANCSKRTVQRRLADPEFRARIEEARATLRDEIFGRLTDAANEAVEVLWEKLRDTDNPGLQVRSANALLDALFKIQSFFPRQSAEIVQTTRVRTTIEQ